MKTLIAIAIMTIGTVRADNAWDNYYNNTGEYFDKFFWQPRVIHYFPDRSAHEATLKFMAREWIPYRNQYTGKLNLSQKD